MSDVDEDLGNDDETNEHDDYNNSPSNMGSAKPNSVITNGQKPISTKKRFKNKLEKSISNVSLLSLSQTLNDNPLQGQLAYLFIRSYT